MATEASKGPSLELRAIPASPAIGETVGEGSRAVDDSPTYLKGYRLACLLASLMLATTLVAIDNTIIGVAVPRITTEFRALNDVGWYSSAYLIAVTALQPTYGKCYKVFNVRYIYLYAIVVFEVGSIVCATAKKSYVFIIGRTVAGIGAGAIFQGSLQAINLVAPLHKRPLYFSIVVSVFALAVCIGPILGGAITDRVTWRWCFWINVPIGGVAGLFSLFFLKLRTGMGNQKQVSFLDKLKSLDALGAVTMIGGVTCLLLALQWGGQRVPWRSARIICLFIAFGILMVAFWYIQWTLDDRATIPLPILRQRSVLMGCLFIALLDMTAYTYAYYLPFYFQGVEGTSALTSGIRFIPLVVPQITAIALSGAFVSRFGHYVPFMATGSILTCVGTGLITSLGTDASLLRVAAFLVLTGIGMGLCMQQPYTVVTVVLKEEDVPIGNGEYSPFSRARQIGKLTLAQQSLHFSNNWGGISTLTVLFEVPRSTKSISSAISVPIGEAIFLNKILKDAPSYTPDIPPRAIIAAGSTNLHSLASNSSSLHALRALYARAISSTFILATVTAAVALPIALLVEWKPSANMRFKKISKENPPQSEEMDGDCGRLPSQTNKEA